jgi:hypothetical protein
MENKKPAEGVVGPGMDPNDINLNLPDCVKILSPKDEEDFRQFLGKIIQATNKNAVRQLQFLCSDLANRLGNA